MFSYDPFLNLMVQVSWFTSVLIWIVLKIFVVWTWTFRFNRYDTNTTFCINILNNILIWAELKDLIFLCVVKASLSVEQAPVYNEFSQEGKEQ